MSTATAIEQTVYACSLDGINSPACVANVAALRASGVNSGLGFMFGPAGQAFTAT